MVFYEYIMENKHEVLVSKGKYGGLGAKSPVAGGNRVYEAEPLVLHGNFCSFSIKNTTF